MERLELIGTSRFGRVNGTSKLLLMMRDLPPVRVRCPPEAKVVRSVLRLVVFITVMSM